MEQQLRRRRVHGGGVLDRMLQRELGRFQPLSEPTLLCQREGAAGKLCFLIAPVQLVGFVSDGEVELLVTVVQAPLEG